MANIHKILSNSGPYIAKDGSLGIGTISPGSKLEVKTSGSNSVVELDNSDTNYSLIQFNAQGATKGFSGFNTSFMVFGGESGTDTRLQAGGQYGLTIRNSDRNVGIGTTDPQDPLHILGSANGNVNLRIENSNTGTNAYASLRFENNSIDTGVLFLNSSNNTQYGGANSLNLYQGGNHTIGFNTNNLLRMAIKGNGTVGIGTNSPTNTLVLARSSAGQGEHGLRLEFTDTNGPTSTSSALLVGSYGLKLKNYNSSRHFSFETGNVGIGTDSPTYKLQVQGTFYVNETAYINGNTEINAVFQQTGGEASSFSGNLASKTLTITPSGEMAQRWNYYTSGGNDFSLEHHSGGMYIYNRTTSAALWSWSNAGYFGIGTDVTPSLALDVKGTTNLASRFMFTKDLSTDKVLFGGADHDTFGAPFIGSSSAHSFTITQGGGAAITIDTSKNVGIGTDSPEGKLMVQTTGANATPPIKINRERDGGRIQMQYNGAENGYGEIGQMYAGVGQTVIWIGANLNSFATGHSSVAVQDDSSHESWFSTWDSYNDRFTVSRINTSGTTSTPLIINSSGATFEGDNATSGIIRSAKNIVSNSIYNLISMHSTRSIDDYGGLGKNYIQMNLVTPGASTTGGGSAHGYGNFSLKLANNGANTNMTEVLNIEAGGTATFHNNVDATNFRDKTNSSYSFTPNSTNKWQLNTPSGYLRMGPGNTSYAHIETDRDQFYFNKKLVVNSGEITSYDENFILRRANSNATLTLGEDSNATNDGWITMKVGEKKGLVMINGSQYLTKYLHSVRTDAASPTHTAYYQWYTIKNPAGYSAQGLASSFKVKIYTAGKHANGSCYAEYLVRCHNANHQATSGLGNTEVFQLFKTGRGDGYGGSTQDLNWYVRNNLSGWNNGEIIFRVGRANREPIDTIKIEPIGADTSTDYMPTLVSHGGGTGANDGRPTTDIQEITMQYAGLQRTGTADARLIIDADGAANGTAHEIARFVNTSSNGHSSYFYIGSTSGTDWRVGKNILGTSGKANFEIATHSGTTKALEINSSSLDATFAGNVVIGTVDSISTGLNIGEASPTIQLFDTTNDAKLLMYTQDNSSVIGTYSNHPLSFFTNSTERITILNTGHVGIGSTTPSYRLQVYDATSDAPMMIQSGDGFVGIKFKDPDADDNLYYRGDTESFYFTGNRLGVNTSNPTRNLSVYQGDSGSSYAHFINTTTGSNAGDGVVVGISDAEDAILWNHEDTDMRFATNNAERMRIDNGGIMYIMGATPSTNNSLQMQYNSTAGSAEISAKSTGGNTHFEFYTSSSGTTTEKMRIKSDGNVTMSTDGMRLRIGANSIGAGLRFGADNDNNSILYASNAFIFSTYQGNGYQWKHSGTEKMRFETDGDLHVDGDVIAYSTTVSDKALKDNVLTLENSLDKVSKLRGVEYTWNATSRKGQKDIGVIAQEVEEVIPEIVREKKMALIEGGTYKTVDYEKLTAVLIEAVKELKEEVEELKRCECKNCNCK